MSDELTPKQDSPDWLAAIDVPEDQREEGSKKRKQDWWARNVGLKKRVSAYNDDRFAPPKTSSDDFSYDQIGRRGGRFRIRYNKQGMPYRQYF